MPKPQSPADVLKRAEGAPSPAQPPVQQLGWATIQMPSRGVLYGGKVPGAERKHSRWR